ncbi:MAG: aspartate aminotransferase family protein [Christensenellales bacterium]|jgi:acetylornithine/N-succinyldiaminopimelate aminotransferase
MVFDSIKKRDDQYVLHTYNRFPVAVSHGKNATLWDFDGNEYIDFTSGIGVNSLGFADESWQKAITDQLGKVQHMSNLYYTKPCIDAAQILCEKTGMSKVFFCNSGAEANEGAIKAARKYSFMKYGGGRSNVISLNNSFHGRTVTTLSATGQDVFHNYFFPFTEGFIFADANDIDDVKAKMDGSVCAVMVELIQGEGGVLPLADDFVKALADECSKRDILLIIDEVQTGAGRTGSLFCFMQAGISPDIVTSAKGIGGGLPLGAVLFNEKAKGALTAGDHATTFGGNPIACAGAVQVLSRMDDEFLAEVKEKGAYISRKIKGMRNVKTVSGMGLMIGVELDEDFAATAADVVNRGIGYGVLLLTAKAKVRLLPPLTITYDEIDKGLAALSKALQQD